MGHKELWEVKQERDRIYALPEMSEEDGYKVADLEVKYGEMDGYLRKLAPVNCCLAWEFQWNSTTAR